MFELKFRISKLAGLFDDCVDLPEHVQHYLFPVFGFSLAGRTGCLVLRFIALFPDKTPDLIATKAKKRHLARRKELFELRVLTTCFLLRLQRQNGVAGAGNAHIERVRTRTKIALPGLGASAGFWAGFRVTHDAFHIPEAKTRVQPRLERVGPGAGLRNLVCGLLPPQGILCIFAIKMLARIGEDLLAVFLGEVFLVLDQSVHRFHDKIEVRCRSVPVELLSRLSILRVRFGPNPHRGRVRILPRSRSVLLPATGLLPDGVAYPEALVDYLLDMIFHALNVGDLNPFVVVLHPAAQLCGHGSKKVRRHIALCRGHKDAHRA